LPLSRQNFLNCGAALRVASDAVDAILRKKALELVRSKMQELAKPQRRELTDAEAVKIVREITRGSRSEEIIENALALYKPYVMPIFRRIAELHEQGAIKELSDYELYEILLRAGIRVPLKTEIKIVRHGREYRLGELS